MIHHSVIIDREARVANTARIGGGTRICQFSSVLGLTTLGEDCLVWPNVMLDGPSFGDRCKIASGVAMGPGFAIGSDVFIGPNVVFANDMWPAVDREGFDINALKLGRPCVIVEDGASIGANAVVLPGVIIGKRAKIAALATVDRDVPADCLFTRDGEIRAVPENWRQRRMRWVNA